jgi:hypothetical protein
VIRTCGDTIEKTRGGGGMGLHPPDAHAALNTRETRSPAPECDLTGAGVRCYCLNPPRCTRGNKTTVRWHEIALRNHDAGCVEGEALSRSNPAVRGSAPRPAERSRKKATIVALATLVLIIGGARLLPAQESGLYLLDEKQPILVNKRAKEVRILAELQPQAFAGSLLRQQSGYHAVVWKRGKAAGESLLTSVVDDSALYDAMVSIGAIPGNNLTVDAWNERSNPESSAADTRVEGTPVHVLVWWPGLRSPLRLDEMLLDSSGLGLDLRFGGNKALIPAWRSGCIICLYSCPGAKIGNRAHTIRDYVKHPKNYSVDYSRVPKGIRKALVIVRLKDQGITAIPGRTGQERSKRGLISQDDSASVHTRE